MDNAIAIAIAKHNKPSSQQVTTAVDDWLDDHPEATTTVEDGAITLVKINANALSTVEETRSFLGIQ